MKSRFPVLLTAPLAIVLVMGGCEPSDPLIKVRELQDQRGDFSGSIETLRVLLETRPDDPEVQLRYGLALLASGSPRLALWPLRRAMEHPEWESAASLALASAYLKSGSFTDAIEMASREIERDPKNAQALQLRADAQIRSRQDYAGALADADRILEFMPEDSNALAARGIALLALGRPDEAAATIEELESRHQDASLGYHGSSGYCTARAKFAEEKGDVAQAEERYLACLEWFPGDASLISTSMQFFDAQGQSERATQTLRKALEERPESQAIRLALAARLRAHESDEAALEVLRAGTKHDNPGVAADSWAGLARLLIDLGEYDAAVDAFRQVRKLAGADDLLLFAMADAMVMAGQLDEAQRIADEISNESYQALVKGRAALVRGDAARAQEYFDAGLLLWPNNPIARYYAALAAEQLADFDGAIENYRYAMRIDARATDAYLRVARLHEAAGRPQEALAALRFMPGGRQFEPEAALHELRLLARLGRSSTSSRVLQRLTEPAQRGRAAVAIAEGVRQRAGAAEAVSALREIPALDFRDPRYARALEALVEQLAATGKAGEALAEVDRALSAEPDSPVFLALRGLALQRVAGGDTKVRAAFERALALDADQRVALLGLAELEAEKGDREAALARYEKVLALEPDDRAAAHGAAAQLVALGRSGRAEELWAKWLVDHPYDADAALGIARLRVDRGALDAHTRAMADRAVYFGAGEAAVDLRDRLTADAAAADRRDAGG